MKTLERDPTKAGEYGKKEKLETPQSKRQFKDLSVTKKYDKSSPN